jgi:hypothetical protein
LKGGFYILLFYLKKNIHIFNYKIERHMLDKLNNILIILEDAMDTESWDLVKSAHAKLEELYERMEMEDTFGSDDDY